MQRHIYKERIWCGKVTALLLLLFLTAGCSALEEHYRRDPEVHKRISALELGISKQQALEAIKYTPNFVQKEAFEGGYREIIVYLGKHDPEGLGLSSIPMLYRLVFENGKLVFVAADPDRERIERNEAERREKLHREAEERRIATIVAEELKKAKQEEEKKNENKRPSTSHQPHFSRLVD